MKTRKIIRGRIIMVQESRFRLTDSEGDSFLLSLSSWANTDENALLNYFNGGRTVQVEYEGEAEINTGIAHKVSVLPRIEISQHNTS